MHTLITVIIAELQKELRLKPYELQRTKHKLRTLISNEGVRT